MNHNNISSIFWFMPILISFLFASLEIINRICKVSKGFITIFIFLIFLTGFAQETHNLEIIWVKGIDNSLFFTYGFNLSSGDFNNDDYSDIVVHGDSWVDPLHGICIYKSYIFWGGLQFDTIPDVVIESDTTWGFIEAKGIGDINGDGFDDLALGDQHGPDGYGRVYIYLGGNPMDTICDYQIKGQGFASNFGQAVSSGDINGDSFNDIIVGAYTDYTRPGGSEVGRVYIYFGGPNFDTIPDVILNGGHDGQLEGFGIQVGSGGDVNNDGKEDVIIGADGYGSSFWGNGRIYIYYGGNPMDTSYDVAMTGEVPNQCLGWTPKVNIVKTEFEYDMAVFGSGFWPNDWPAMNSGKIYVLFGGNPMDNIPDIWMIGRTDSSALGQRISNAGFVNQTNSEAIISGAPKENGGKGAAYLWLGGILLDTTPDAWIKGVQYDDGIGWYVASAGDVNGDGRDEFMVSNYASDYTPKRVWVCKYTDSGIEGRPPITNRLPLEVSPIPAKSVIRVHCPLNVKEIKIIDVSGKLVKEEKVASLQSHKQEIRISLKGINPGIYFIRLGKETKKFLVVK